MKFLNIFDKVFCASPACTNECNRKMTDEEKEYLKELAFRGVSASKIILQGYFCGVEPRVPLGEKENV